jgi:DNA invertase Pin-like site-specific DNA recombinase
MLHLYAALAEKERRLIADRTTAALQAKKAGQSWATRQISMERIAQAQIADEFATKLMPLVQAIQNAGALTLKQIACALNGRGVRPARGGKWHRSSVRNLLARIE